MIRATGAQYSIGEFAAITGVSTDTLRLYEKQDIITPTKNCNNNYRYYTDLDARNVLMSRWYRSMNIPLYQVSTLMNGGTSNQVIDRISASKLHLEEQIRKYTMLLAKMNEIHEELQSIESRLCQCQLKQIPGRYRIKQTDQNYLLRERDLRDPVNEWMDLLPYTFFSFRIEHRDVMTDTAFRHSWGVCLTEEDALKLQAEIPDEVEYFPPALCLSSVIYTSPQAPFSMKSFAFMLDEIASRGLQITGDITGKILLSEHVEMNSSTYLEVNIPI
ncbi:MerR family transcriptional regulator [Paenibacillus segetis]|uniref:MerR family transcriptional regulator n=1 Tax=Paenibacillus segetis TaxID=1325360 RepID=A0ABQ1YNW7_9BACL|nr:MerR family transcriptional regulator [Paenibacillus segetis]GGH31032.1 MerR family transcriptional regulator [Paenibacillus segetis]